MALAQNGAGALVHGAERYPGHFALKVSGILQVNTANVGALPVDAAKLRGAVKMAAGAIFCGEMRRER